MTVGQTKHKAVTLKKVLNRLVLHFHHYFALVQVITIKFKYGEFYKTNSIIAPRGCHYKQFDRQVDSMTLNLRK